MVTHILYTLFHTLYNMCVTMCPFIPFITEKIYQTLKKLLPKEKQLESIHLHKVSESKKFHISLEAEKQMECFERVVEMVRMIRSQHKLSMRKPMKQVFICHDDK